MEEEKQNFSKLMKDARRRCEEFLATFEKNTPFFIRRADHRCSRASRDLANSEVNRRLYRKMSCKSENSDDSINIAKGVKVRSRGKHKKLKKRLRHSVIGTEKEIGDLEVLLLNEASEYTAYHDDDCKTLSNDNALDVYFSQLYSRDKQPTHRHLCSDEKDKTNGAVIREIQEEKPSDARFIRTTETSNSIIRRRFSNEYPGAKARKNYRFSSYIPGSHLTSPERSMFTDDCVVLTREQKRRVKEKMKLALKRPNNYSYLGNL